MTPKEEARELLSKMNEENYLGADDARYCALICVSEIINFIKLCGNNFNWSYTNDRIRTPLEYWEEVKQEIKKSLNQIEYRLKLYQTRSKLQAKGIIHQVKAMINEDLWEKTSLDNNFISGRMMNTTFLKALIKLEHLTE